MQKQWRDILKLLDGGTLPTPTTASSSERTGQRLTAPQDLTPGAR